MASARPTKSKATAPGFVANIFIIRVRSLRVRGHGQAAPGSGGVPTAAIPRPIPDRHTSADAARRTAGCGAAPQSAAEHTSTPSWSARCSISPPWSGPRHEAARCGVAIHDVLMSAGWISEPDYAAALARRLGVPVVAWNAALESRRCRAGAGNRRAGCRGGSTAGRATCWPPTDAAPDALPQQVIALRGARPRRGACAARRDQRGARERRRGRSASSTPCAACSRSR